MSKTYFHDRIVLLLLTVNSFLAIAGILLISLNLGDTSNAYIVQYLPHLNILDRQQVGGLGQILSFIAFIIIVFVFQLIVSLKLYHIRKHASQIVLALTLILLVYTVITSYSLLNLR